MNEIYGWRLKGSGGPCSLRDTLNLLFYIIFVVSCWLHQYTFWTCAQLAVIDVCVCFFLSDCIHAAEGIWRQYVFLFFFFFETHISCQKAKIEGGRELI